MDQERAQGRGVLSYGHRADAVADLLSGACSTAVSLESMPGHAELRRALTEATTLTTPQQYRAEIERLRSVFGHSITVLPHDYGRLKRGEPEPSCYGYAFGLANNARYLQLVAAGAGPDKLQPLSSDSVTMLLAARALRRRRAGARHDDVVLYFHDGQVKHAGVITNAPGRIRSKWGQAEVHEHDLWEVPLSYGNITKTYVPPSAKRILALLGA